MNRDKELRLIKDEILDCKKCSLCKTRAYPVIGQGDHQAKIIFIGEAPGFNEDKTGFPFCGKAGEVLDDLLGSVNIKREDVYITNILKCRPPGNRNPKSEEIKACVTYLERQIKTIKPEIICTLGNFSTAYIFEKFSLKDRIQGISKIHGQVFNADDLKIISLYHPAVVTYNDNMREVLKKDFKVLKNL